MSPDRPELDQLPTLDADPAVVDRIHARARAAFEEERELRQQPLPLAALTRLSRVAFPAALAGAVVVYLSWAMQTASALYP